MLQNLRFALRRLARERGFTAAAVLTLALGVGANVAVFAVVEAVLLQPPPYPDADRLAILKHRDDRTGITKEFIAIGDFIDLAARQQSMDALAAYNFGRAIIYGDSEPIVAPALMAGPGLLETLGASAARGRLLTQDDARQGAAPVVMIGHALWERAYKSDPNVIGRRIRVGTVDREVVGVAAAGFRFPANEHTDLILPLGLPAMVPAQRKAGWVFAVARVRSAGTIEAEPAAAELTSLSQQMEREHPAQNQGSRYFLTSLRDQMAGDTRRPLTLLACAVGAVLLIASNGRSPRLARRPVSRPPAWPS